MMDSATSAHPPFPRVGTGVDVHGYSAPDSDRPLWVAGLRWSDHGGLAGHSDADVVAHAACDAVLSACGLGDIGRLVGIDDPQWSGASGVDLLRHTAQHVRDHGYEIGNISVQLIAVRPRLTPRRTEAERVLSTAVGAPVSVSATTTDGLGLTGRGEGAAAIATAIVFPAPNVPRT
ncbi:2-C-methyl-D-erythritol 2,4-cyclodiphosphate synthase [Micrococcales bacterium KH10]|nr:2-C-methyl-D-erythritol 2,4-cyclodiphosphate synthase [Micrococcales bacterium KH10]